MRSAQENTAYRILVRGLVQGVGFRPFVYRIAHRYALSGSVQNRSDGVVIHAEGAVERLTRFLADLREGGPPASEIEAVDVSEVAPLGLREFRIVPSAESAGAITRVSPDLAVCDACLSDMDGQPRRAAYPFVNCTNCGPRFSIVRSVPYDRSRTSMAEFTMCGACSEEYEDISNRRFHAQPNACRRCGPTLRLWESTDDAEAQAGDHHGDSEAVIRRVARLLEDGSVVAVKGLGGFHIACDARNAAAVRRVREAKLRDGKPFAVMFRDLAAVKRVAFVDDNESALLSGMRRPVVLLELRLTSPEGSEGPPGGLDGSGGGLAGEVSNGLYTIGAMLPYMPFHHMLFARTSLDAVVLTSGNFHDEPIVIDNEEARRRLLPVSDALVTYNRRIENRLDDSVTTVVAGRPRMLRRSRGYVPSPVRVSAPPVRGSGPDAAEGAGAAAEAPAGILAMGGDMKSSFCLGLETGEAVLSQHIGELANPRALDFLSLSLARFTELFRTEPELVVEDLHPEYLSRAFARDYAGRHGLPLLSVQHHHAHLASCMAEHGLREQVIGISMDGTGYGEDGAVWGGEVLVCNLAGYRRLAHLAYVPMPGGEAAIREPWRMAVSYLYAVYGEREEARAVVERLGIVPEPETGARLQTLHALFDAVDKGINTPKTSSAGRLFDAVAALLGLCSVASFEAEGPMRLETAAATYRRGRGRGRGTRAAWELPEAYPYRLTESSGELEASTLDFLPAVQAVVEARLAGMDPSLIAARFHSTMVDAIRTAVLYAYGETGLRTAVCSGGLFQNRILLAETERRLREAGFAVYSQERVPTNDGGLALGQLAIAARRRMADVSGGSREGHLHTG